MSDTVPPTVVRSPDGLEWDVRVRRIDLPRWHESTYDPESDAAGDLLTGAFVYLVVAPIVWFLLPLLRLVAALPVAIVRSLLGSTRWVDATCRSPSEIVITWRTSKAHAALVAEHVATRLQHGYEDLTPPTAELVSMTKPPGTDDLDA